jgi:hypothetical protein
MRGKEPFEEPQHSQDPIGSGLVFHRDKLLEGVC